MTIGKVKMANVFATNVSFFHNYCVPKKCVRKGVPSRSISGSARLDIICFNFAREQVVQLILLGEEFDLSILMP